MCVASESSSTVNNMISPTGYLDMQPLSKEAGTSFEDRPMVSWNERANAAAERQFSTANIYVIGYRKWQYHQKVTGDESGRSYKEI